VTDIDVQLTNHNDDSDVVLTNHNDDSDVVLTIHNDLGEGCWSCSWCKLKICTMIMIIPSLYVQNKFLIILKLC